MITAERNRPAPRSLMLFRSVAPWVIGVGLALALHLLIAPRIEPLYAKVLLDIGINIILAVSLNIVNGFAGQFSIGHAGFMAVGGYTAAATTYYFGGSVQLWAEQALPLGLLSWTRDPSDFTGPLIGSADVLFFAACLAGGTTAAVAGIAVGLPSLRLRGDYLAIVTLGFGEIVRVLFEQSHGQLDTVEAVRGTAPLARFTHLGGSLGMTGITKYATHFWVYLFVAVTLIVAFRLRQSSHGRAFLAIREDPIAAEAMGVPVTRYKVMAFVISAFFAGIAGALFAHQVGVALNPGELGFQKSFDILIMVVLGGLGSISGSVVAATFLTILPEFLRDIAQHRLIIYALLLIVVMIVRPRGLFGLHEVWDFFRRPARSNP